MDLRKNKTFDIKKSYDDGLSDFVFDAASEIGGGLPQEYFNVDELIELEIIFRMLYDANIKLNNLIYKKLYK